MGSLPWTRLLTYRFFTVLEDPLWDLVPSDVNTLACMNILSVSKNYALRGLAHRLINHNLDELL
ncbi:hypothetical protein AAVH_15132 [Aphelenchoides avenae]|nr:hypothetical protein AAVH_15132 [Aphelenchus avenae]